MITSPTEITPEPTQTVIEMTPTNKVDTSGAILPIDDESAPSRPRRSSGYLNGISVATVDLRQLQDILPNLTNEELQDVFRAIQAREEVCRVSHLKYMASAIGISALAFLGVVGGMGTQLSAITLRDPTTEDLTDAQQAVMGTGAVVSILSGFAGIVVNSLICWRRAKADHPDDLIALKNIINGIISSRNHDAQEIYYDAVEASFTTQTTRL